MDVGGSGLGGINLAGFVCAGPHDPKEEVERAFLIAAKGLFTGLGVYPGDCTTLAASARSSPTMGHLNCRLLFKRLGP